MPAELSVVCYEDSPLARWWHPAMTVIDNNARQMGELAARLLLNRLEPADGGGRRQEFSEFRVAPGWSSADSCRARRAAGGYSSSTPMAASSSVRPSSSQRSKAIGTLPLAQICVVQLAQVQAGAADPGGVGEQAR